MEKREDSYELVGILESGTVRKMLIPKEKVNEFLSSKCRK